MSWLSELEEVSRHGDALRHGKVLRRDEAITSSLKSISFEGRQVHFESVSELFVVRVIELRPLTAEAL